MNIQLVREGIAPETVNNQQVWPLKVTATVIDNSMPSSRVFVYHAAMGADSYEGDLFEAVASISQYFSLPEDAAEITDGIYLVPYYRSNLVYFACASPQEADDLWSDIQADVTDLVTNYIAFSDLEVQETVTI
jgi:hypothetical protein